MLYRFQYIPSKYVSVSDLVCWDDNLAKHHPRFTHFKTHSPALLNKLSMAISKHLHNMLKIAPESEFTCCSTLVALSKPHANLRFLRAQTQHLPRPCQFSGHQDKIWLRGTDGLKKMLSVTTLLTNFLKLPLINKEPVGVAAQGKPQAIFQLVSPERQIGILHSALREEMENKKRGGGGEEEERG